MNNKKVNGKNGSASNFFGAHALADVSKEVQEQENIILEAQQKIREENELIAKKSVEVMGMLTSQNGQTVSEEDSDDAVDELVSLLEKTVPEAMESLSCIAEKAQEIINNTKKTASIHQTTPEEKFAKATSLQKHTLTEKDKCRFFEIEEALSNTIIVSAGLSQVIEYQLGLISEAKKADLISEELFAYLAVIRKVYIPDKYKYNLANGRMLNAEMFSICQRCNNSLVEDKEYQSSKNKFIQRLNGIDYELIEKRMGVDELREELSRLQQGENTESKKSTSLASKATLENIRLEGAVDTFFPPPPLSPFKNEIRIEQLKGSKNPGLIVLFEEIKWIPIMLSGIDEKLRYQYQPDGGRICFEKIMQATVKLQTVSPEDEKRLSGLKLTANIETALGEMKRKQHEAMKNGRLVHSCVADELVTKVDLAIKTYKEKTENTFSPLKGEALKVAYLQRLKRINLDNLVKQLKENKCISEEKAWECYSKLLNLLKKATFAEQEKELNKFINNLKPKKSAQKCLNDFKDRHGIIDRVDEVIEKYDPASIQVYQDHLLFPVPDSSCQKVEAPCENSTKFFSKR